MMKLAKAQASLLSTIAAALAVLLGSSCASRQALYPVRAEVFVDGQRAAGALVVLHPIDDNSPAAIRPSGYVADDGSLKLTSYLSSARSVGEGAPVGDYIVTVAWLPPDVKEYLAKHPNGALPDKLQGRYGQPSTSKLRAKVLAQPTELGRFDLSKEPGSNSSPNVSRLRLPSRVGGTSHA